MNAEQEPNLQTQVFEYIKEAADKIGDFAAKEIPPFIEEFLRWKFWEAGFYAGIWLFSFLIFFSSIIYWIKKRKEQIIMAFDRSEPEAFIIFFYSLAAIAGLAPSFFVSFIPSVLTMLQIHIAPKVYLLEKASEYLK